MYGNHMFKKKPISDIFVLILKNIVGEIDREV